MLPKPGTFTVTGLVGSGLPRRCPEPASAAGRAKRLGGLTAGAVPDGAATHERAPHDFSALRGPRPGNLE